MYCFCAISVSLPLSISDPRLMLGSVDINNFSAINMSGEPRLATNHTTIKTLIYCRPAPGGLTELQGRARIKP